MKTLIIGAAVLTLSGFTGCVTVDRHAALPPTPAKVGASLKAPCSQVVDIPDHDLTQGEISDLWAIDRTNLGICFRRHGDLVKAVTALEGQGK